MAQIKTIADLDSILEVQSGFRLEFFALLHKLLREHGHTLADVSQLGRIKLAERGPRAAGGPIDRGPWPPS